MSKKVNTEKIEDENREETNENQVTNSNKTKGIVLVRVPKDKLNDKDQFVNVRINGKLTRIKRGENTTVTENVANVLKEAELI